MASAVLAVMAVMVVVTNLIGVMAICTHLMSADLRNDWHTSTKSEVAMETLFSDYQGLFLLMIAVVGGLFAISALSAIIPARSPLISNVVCVAALVGGSVSLGDYLAERMVTAGADWLVMSVELPRHGR